MSGADFPTVEAELTAPTIAEFCRLVGDPNPLHTDEAFARTTAFGGIIAPGLLTQVLAFRALQAWLGERRPTRSSFQVKFLKPTRPGERLVGRGEPVEGDPGRVRLWVENARGESCLVIEAELAFEPAAAVEGDR